MVSNRIGNGFYCFRILVRRCRAFEDHQAAGTPDFLQLDEFLFRPLRDVHALASVPRAQPECQADRSNGTLLARANPNAHALDLSGL